MYYFHFLSFHLPLHSCHIIILPLYKSPLLSFAIQIAFNAEIYKVQVISSAQPGIVPFDKTQIFGNVLGPIGHTANCLGLL